MGYRAFIGKIRKGKEEEYVAVHRNVWPELLDAMKEVGVEKESCFVFGSYIFVYVEAADIVSTLEKLQNNPVNQKWDVFMEPILEPPIDGCPEFFPEMTEVFRM
jgi:L-rhamnose mutarotase